MKIPAEPDVFSLLSLSVSPAGWEGREEEGEEEEEGQVHEGKFIKKNKHQVSGDWFYKNNVDTMGPVSQKNWAENKQKSRTNRSIKNLSSKPCDIKINCL